MRNQKKFTDTMKRGIKKATVVLLTSCLFLTGNVGSPWLGSGVVQAANTCDTYAGNNIEMQNYSTWGSTVESYLTVLEDGSFMRVQWLSEDSKILVEYYDASYQLLSSKKVSGELPIFGGFYSTGDYYYIVSGQNNPEESASLEVYRITKYDKNWKRLGSDGLKDCNTTVPFDAGSCRMDHSGKYLLIHTCHEMYRSSDGLNHQANVTIQVDMDAMKITDSYTDAMNTNLGYVSHSFNQFVKIEDNKMITVDHGDAYPRSLVLLKYQTDISQGTFTPDYFDSPCEVVDVLEFPGNIGANQTGASLGALEISDQYYLVAGNSVIQDEQNLSRSTRNIFVAAVEKKSSRVKLNWITSYAEGSDTASTPHMVALEDGSYLLLWSRSGKVHYTKIDTTGKTDGKIYQMDAQLSDCVPVLSDGKVVWYTWNSNQVIFYEISLSNLSKTTQKEIFQGHNYKTIKEENGIRTLKCEVCQEETTINFYENLKVWWNEDNGSWWSSAFDNNRQAGSDLYFRLSLGAELPYAMEVISSNPNVASVEMFTGTTGVIHAKGSGTTTISVKAKANLDYQRDFFITVVGGTPAPEQPAPEQPQPEDSQEKKVSKNTKLTKNGISYKVTKTGTHNKAEATVVKAKTQKTYVILPTTITIQGVKCKVTAISANAFKNQKKLKKAVIGKHVKKIGKRAFYGCKKLKNITVKSTVLKTVGNQAFASVHPKVKLKVSKKNKYKTYKKLMKL